MLKRWMAVCACTAALLLTALWGSARGDATIPDGRITGGTSQGYFANLTAAQGIRLGDLVQIVRGETVAATALVSGVSDHDCTLLVVDPVGATLRIGDTVRFLKHRNLSPVKPPPVSPSPGLSPGTPSPEKAATPSPSSMTAQKGIEIVAMKMAVTPMSTVGAASSATMINVTVSLRNTKSSPMKVWVTIDVVCRAQSALGEPGNHFSSLTGSITLGAMARQDINLSGHLQYPLVAVYPETNSFTISVMDPNKGTPSPVELELKPTLFVQ